MLYISCYQIIWNHSQHANVKWRYLFRFFSEANVSQRAKTNWTKKNQNVLTSTQKGYCQALLATNSQRALHSYRYWIKSNLSLARDFQFAQSRHGRRKLNPQPVRRPSGVTAVQRGVANANCMLASQPVSQMLLPPLQEGVNRTEKWKYPRQGAPLCQ